MLIRWVLGDWEISNQLVKASEDIRDDNAYLRFENLKTQEMIAAQKTYKMWEEARTELTGTKAEPFEIKRGPDRITNFSVR
jgi:hypothetical protein